LVEKHQNKEILGRPRSKWEDNIKIDLVEMVGFCEHGNEIVVS
jgi:hypothetical protein